jgi:endoglucanase
MKLDLPLFKRLCETPGVPGREERVRQLVEKEVLGKTKGLFDEHRVDAMGSLICTRYATKGAGKSAGKRDKAQNNPTRVLLAAHMDEIGFYVRHVDDNGYLWLNPAGGFDPRNLFATRVLVVTDGGDIRGVMNPGGKPIHISSEAERSKVPSVEEFFVDLGMASAEVKKRVKVGDYVVLDQSFMETPLKVVSKALDNRMAVFVAIEAVRRIAAKKQRHAADIVVAFCTQEEVGLRGATIAANQVGADIGVGLDVNLACDTPGVPDTQRVTKQGDGAAVMVQDSSMISDYRLVDDICAVARKHRIPCQRAVLPRGGQDGAAIQRSGKGARCVALGAGTRYIHTTTEMIDKGDLEAVVDLLTAWLVTID